MLSKIMKKNKIFIVGIIMLLIALIMAFVILLKQNRTDNNTKHYCDIDIDCVLTDHDPDGYATCANNIWNIEWNKRPESQEYAWECLLYGSEQCGCVNQKCQRIDEGEPGC